MERTDMLAVLDDLHGDALFALKYGRLPSVEVTVVRVEALRQGILELKGHSVKVIALEGDDEEAIATTRGGNG